jgi:hypothetical protein
MTNQITPQMIDRAEKALSAALPEGVGFFLLLAPYATQVAIQEIACKSNINQQDLSRVLKKIVTRIDSQLN